MPTREDVFPMVYVEAMASGLPCIGTRVMAVPELVRDGYNGLLIEPRERKALSKALRTLIDDEELRLTMGRNGRESAKREFDNVSSCQQIARIFEACAVRNW